LNVGECYAAWLKAHGLVFFRVTATDAEHVEVELVQFQWGSGAVAQNFRAIFSDARELRNAAMMSSTWWPHVERVVLAEAPRTFIRYDQLGWWTPQPWMPEKLPKSSS
jgi:hypothetical protein